MDAATREGEELVSLARQVATTEHEGQLDKAGLPYISHPARVAARVATAYGPEFVAVAWLHDVIEDTRRGTSAEDLRALGLPDAVVAGVVAMTKRPSERDDSTDAVRRACADPIALVVKAADVADNSDPMRLEQLPLETRDRLATKYRRYREELDASSAPRFAQTVVL